MSPKELLKTAFEKRLGYCPDPLPVSPLDEFNRIFTFLSEERESAKKLHGEESPEYLKATNEYRMFALATDIQLIKVGLLERMALKEAGSNGG